MTPRDREIERLRAWVDSRRPPLEPSTWREWAVDALATAFIGAAGFVIIYFVFSL